MMPGGVTTPGGKPVTAVPGLTPRFPTMMLEPVLVTVEPPRTPKLAAVPSVIWANAGEAAKTRAANPMLARRLKLLVLYILTPKYLLVAGHHLTTSVTRPGAGKSHRTMDKTVPI